jgi:signal transduction histidine kinase
MTESGLRSLLVDDIEGEFVSLNGLLQRLRGPRVALDWVAGYADGLAALEGDQYDLYFVDYRLGAGSGLDLIRQARQLGVTKPIIMLTGDGSEAVDEAATAAGANEYLVKGAFDHILLERTIRYAIRSARTVAALGRRRVESDAIARELTLQATRRATAEAELIRMKEDLEGRVRAEVAVREAVQQSAVHGERLQALGQLAGGIAHDFNNMLQAVEGAAAMIEHRAQDNAEILRLARLLLDTAARGASTTRRLLAFSRRDDLRPEMLDVFVVLGSLREMLAHSLEAGIAVRTEVAPGLPFVFADKGQLDTVLVNLATNARDAMPMGGELVVSADAEIVLPEGPAHPAGLAPGCYVRLSVTDTGHGMDHATLMHACEPFFTTKKAGVGTGLGLPMVRGFMEQSGGGFSLSSGPGEGTEVTLWLPEAVSGSVRDAGAPRETVQSSAAEAAPVGTLGRVLVVDDEAMVLELLAEHLEDAGFSVVTAANGTEAVALLEADETLDALVTDLSMPDMSGLAVIRAAQERHSGLPTVLLTGYADDDATAALNNARPGSFVLLHKPIRALDLVAQLQGLLAGRDQAAVLHG